MKTASRLMVAAALALGLASLQPAAAAPVTFRFELPDWTVLDGSPATYGTHGVLTVTVDNGADDLIAQTYLNNSIQSIRMAASGGSYDHAFAGTMAVPPSSWCSRRSCSAHARWCRCGCSARC